MSSTSTLAPVRLETERLYLRSFQPGDGGWYFAAGQRNRAHLAEFESGNVVLEAKNPQEAESIVQDLAAVCQKGSAFFLAGFDKATDEFVVQLYLGRVNAELLEYEIGYFVDVEHEGRGHVAEAVNAALAFAFEKLGAHRVSLECDDTNVRSWRVAQRCGFVREGHRRENKRHADGRFTGTLHYAMLRREFEEQQSQAGK